MRDLHDPAFVKALFDEMSATYGLVNLVTSFGFSARWRRQCLDAACIGAGARVLDLMTGMGELLPGIAARAGQAADITGVDFSAVMCARAAATVERLDHAGMRVREADALDTGLPDASFDVIVSSFGLKTLSAVQLTRLAAEVARLLAPGGRVSFVEISVPPARLLRWPYGFYIRYVIPLLGRLFAGNPENYRMLGVYTHAFGDSTAAIAAFREAGLRLEPRRYFFGCATGFVGTRAID